MGKSYWYDYNLHFSHASLKSRKNPFLRDFEVGNYGAVESINVI